MSYYRCPECRTRKQSWADMIKHMQSQQHAVCRCSGYHHPHRPGSGACFKNQDWRLHHARRAGHVAEACPF